PRNLEPQRSSVDDDLQHLLRQRVRVLPYERQQPTALLRRTERPAQGAVQGGEIAALEDQSEHDGWARASDPVQRARLGDQAEESGDLPEHRERGPGLGYQTDRSGRQSREGPQRAVLGDRAQRSRRGSGERERGARLRDQPERPG